MDDLKKIIYIFHNLFYVFYVDSWFSKFKFSFFSFAFFYFLLLFIYHLFEIDFFCFFSDALKTIGRVNPTLLLEKLLATKQNFRNSAGCAELECFLESKVNWLNISRTYMYLLLGTNKVDPCNVLLWRCVMFPRYYVDMWGVCDCDWWIILLQCLCFLHFNLIDD